MQPSDTDMAVNAIGGVASNIPVAGTFVSAGVGAYNLYRKSVNASKVRRLEQEKVKAAKDQNFRNLLQTFPSNGVATPSLYMGKGGAIGAPGFKYKAEAGEVVVHSPSDNVATDKNGSAHKLSSDMSKLEGDKHSAPSGGIGASNMGNAFVFSDQIPLPAELSSLIKSAKI